MSEEKSSRKPRQKPEHLELEDELSPDEFLEQFADGGALDNDEMSEEEFFAAFDRHQAGEAPIFAGEDDSFGDDLQGFSQPPNEEEQASPSVPSESYYIPEEEELDRPVASSVEDKDTDQEYSEEYYEEGESYGGDTESYSENPPYEDPPYEEEGEYQSDDQYPFEEEPAGVDDYGYEGYEEGEDFFDPNEPLFEDEEYEEDVRYDEPEVEQRSSIRLSEGISYDLESKLKLPKKPRRRGRFLETLFSLIALPLVFAVAGGMGLYMYKPELVVPYIPQEYKQFLPKIDVIPAEPTLPPGVLEAVMSEPVFETPLPEPTPTPVLTRAPIGVVEPPKPTVAPTSTPKTQSATAPLAKATPRPTPFQAATAAPVRTPVQASNGLPPGAWYVQVSAEATPLAAERLKNKIVDDGLPGDVYSIEIRGRKYYRVVVGPTSKREASRLMAVLRKKSYISNTPFLREGK